MKKKIKVYMRRYSGRLERPIYGISSSPVLSSDSILGAISVPSLTYWLTKEVVSGQYLSVNIKKSFNIMIKKEIADLGLLE